MATSVQISVAEYLASHFRPDCEYIDGELVERNVGERDHSTAQMRLGAYLFNRTSEFGISVFPEQRVQVLPYRYRVPDLCAVLGPEPEEQVFTTPPFLCVEILSPGDTIAAMQEHIQDYLNFGVNFVWIVDPRLKRAFVYTAGRTSQAGLELLTENPRIAVPLSAIF